MKIQKTLVVIFVIAIQIITSVSSFAREPRPTQGPIHNVQQNLQNPKLNSDLIQLSYGQGSINSSNLGGKNVGQIQNIGIIQTPNAATNPPNTGTQNTQTNNNQQSNQKPNLLRQNTFTITPAGQNNKPVLTPQNNNGPTQKPSIIRQDTFVIPNKKNDGPNGSPGGSSPQNTGPNPLNNQPDGSPPNTAPNAQPKPFSYANAAGQKTTTTKPAVANSATQPKVINRQGSVTQSTTANPNHDDKVTDEELRTFSEAVLRRDVNNAGKFVTINYQGKVKDGSDEAPQPLLTVNPEAYQIPTIAKLRLLFNNYIQDAAVNEYVTAQERQEENELLDAVIATPIMVHTRKFLIEKGVLSQDPKDFKDTLKRIWFNMYSRGHGKIGSSAFEHVFLAELKKNEISGLHNWIYFNDEEHLNHADYLGYSRKVDLGDKGAIIKLRFKLNGIEKPTNGFFVGTSPELEMSLYTVCFLLRPDRICPQKLAGNKFVIRTYTFRYRGKNMIGSAFPEI